MSDDQAAATGVSETQRGDSVIFRVKQNKYGHLKTGLKLLAVMVGGWALSGAMLSTGWGLFALLGALGLIVWGIGTLIMGLTVFAVLATMPVRRDAAEFSIGPREVELMLKQEKAYPDRVPADAIHALYIKGPDQTPHQYSQTTFIAGPAGMVAVHAFAEGATNLSIGAGKLLGSRMAKTSWGVAIKAYGKEIMLATLLREGQAEYLMHRIEHAFAGR